jgi:soluble lytic murein transglycosylase
VLYAIRRMARGDETEAHDRWFELKPRYSFTAEEVGATERDIALIAGWRHNPQAHDWLSAVPDHAADAEVHEWRVRSAIASGLWSEVLRHIAAMPSEQADAEEWRYWRGMALRETGAHEQASEQFALLARERDYHGFLAADALRWPYVMDNRPLEVGADVMDELAAHPGLVRAHELYLAGLLTEARREWHAATAEFDADRLRGAAQLAHSWGWHDRAILTVARSADFNDLVLRFPIDHVDDIERHTKQYQLDPGHVLAVIRTESAFNPQARSGAGAMGLMQLMPATGRSTARKYGIPLPGTQQLYDADRNIQIGSAYLKQVMEQYDDNVVLASAAYNAGPHRVRRWLPEEEQLPAENWIATIPFDETRGYVQRILAYAAIYDWRMERPVTPLSDMMPDVKPRDSYSEQAQ